MVQNAGNMVYTPAVNHFNAAQHKIVILRPLESYSESSDPYFKCEWNIDLFYSQNMFSHLGAFRRDVLLGVGGFKEGFEGSQDHDLVLRCIEVIDGGYIHHIPRVLYHWRAHAASTAYESETKPYAKIAGARA